MSTTIILVAYHGARWLPACVSSLAGASRERLHLVLVDNDGDNGLAALDLTPFDAEVIATPHPMGFAEANNHALVRASRLEEHVLFLNQDTVSPPGWLDACTEALAREADLGAVSPLIRTYEDDGWDPSFVACLAPDDRDAPEAAGAVVRVPHVPAPALLMPSDVLREVGPFDPVFGSYYEDYDLCRRVRASGRRVAFCGRARVRHFSGGSTTTDAQHRRRQRQIVRNRMLYRLREDAAPRWRGVIGWTLVDLPRRLARGLLGRPGAQSPSATLGAALDLVRLAPRLVSRRQDEAAWHAYLDELDWPPAARPATPRTSEVHA